MRKPHRQRRRVTGARLLLVLSIVAGVVAAPAFAAVTEYYRDSFVSGGFSGSTGTVPWSSSWIESEGDGPSSGLIQVDNEGQCFDGQCLVLGKDDSGSATVEREMDLSNAIGAELTFRYKTHTHGDGAGSVRLRARTQSGSWATVATYALGIEVGPATETISLLPYASSATRIRFEVVNSTDDSHLNVDDVQVEWTASTNDPPTLDPIGNKSVGEGSQLGFTATATDPDAGDNLTFSLAGGPPAGATISSGGVFTWTPTEAQGPGSYSFDVVVSDDGAPVKSDSENITVMVSEVNATPVLTSIGNKTANEGSQLSFTASATDADSPANTLTFSLAGGPPSGATISQGGSFTWTPSESQGPGIYSFRVVVADSGSPNKSDNETITVTVNEVNQAPVLGTIGDRATEQGSSLSFTATASDVDVPGNPLSYRLEGSVPGGATIGTSSGVFNWSVPVNQPVGSYTFDVVVEDNGSPKKSDRETITISVAKVNQAPVLNTLSDRTVDEGATVSFTASGSDPDGPDGGLVFSLSGAPSGATIGSSSGVFRWTPSEIRGPGSYSFDVVVTDAAPVARSDQETITITVREVNRPPVVEAPSAVEVAEGELLELVIVATDPDVPTNDLSFSLTGAPEGVSIDGTGRLSYSPTDGDGDAVHIFDVVVTDNGTPTLSGSATMSVSVIAVNQPPVIDPIPDQFSEETDAIELPVVVADPEGASVAVSVEGLPPGLAFDPDAAAIVGTIEEGAAALSPFSVAVIATDSDPIEPVTAEIGFSWEVLTANTPPSSTPVTLETPEDTPIGTVLEALDPDDDPVTFALASQPAHGTATIRGAVVTYRPDRDWNGTDSFTFVAADPREASVPVPVVVRVLPVNDPPAAGDDTYVAYSGGSLLVEAPGILDNDYDADGEPLVIGLVTDPAGGTLTVAADGGFTYRPDDAFLGTDTFTYRLTDAADAVAVGTVTIRVEEPVSSGIRSTIVAGVASPDPVDPAPAQPVRVVERSLVLMNSAARQTMGDVGFPMVVLALALGMILSLGRITGSPLGRRSKSTGRIEMIDHAQGFGLLSPDDDPSASVFFHRSAIRPRGSRVKPGMRVVYHATSGEQRPVATRLREEAESGLGRLRTKRR